jgi:gamma-glutamylputrescine oxidase
MSDLPSSYYRAAAGEVSPRQPLQARVDVRVAIVGGGFAGLNTALGLAERGVTDVALLESRHIGFGASGRNGGFVFAGYSLGEDALVGRVGAQRAATLYSRTVDAVNLIRERITRYDIACDMVDQGVIWANWFRDPEVLRRRQRLLAATFDSNWQWLPAPDLRELLRTSRYNDGLYEANALHLNPLAYARGLADAAAAAGIRIHEDSRVLAISRDGAGWIVRTSEGELRAEHVVLACGGYLAGLRRSIDRAILPIATYVMVTEPLGDQLGDCIRTRAAIYDTRFAFDYYRPLNDTRLLWGGRISVRDRSAKAVKKLLRRDMLHVYPQLADARIDYAWSGLMSYARHQMPQVGRQSDGLWYAQAFGGHGLAPTCAAGEHLAQAIIDGESAADDHAAFGLERAWRPMGYAAAQATYWYEQSRDWLKRRMEG